MMIESLFLAERKQEKGSQDQGSKSGGLCSLMTLHHFLAEIYRRLKYSDPQELCGRLVKDEFWKLSLHT
jgi:hypothetical protein